MWYQRLVSWIRSLFTVSMRASTPVVSNDAERRSLPRTAPLHGPLAARDQTPPAFPPVIEFPPRREPPTTAPLARLARPSEPLTGLPTSGPASRPPQMFWNGREPAPPSQPLRSSPPSIPLPEPRLPEEPIWLDAITEPEFLAPDGDEQDDTPPTIEPGSDLYRRLMALRRLVRQRIYNEGFPPNAIPDQYKSYGGDRDDDPFGSPFDE